jgi:large subunit ribosomal protein L24
MALRIRRGDLVQVVTGSDRGKQGRVLAVDRERGRVRVEKVRMQKRHLRPGRKALKTGGVLEQEGYLDLSNVMLVDPETHRPSRLRVQADGTSRRRVFARSGKPAPDPSKA